MRFQVTVDDVLGKEIQSKAQELGFSTSSYVRYILKSSLKQSKLNKIDKALMEDSETITLENFKKQLEDLK